MPVSPTDGSPQDKHCQDTQVTGPPSHYINFKVYSFLHVGLEDHGNMYETTFWYSFLVLWLYNLSQRFWDDVSDIIRNLNFRVEISIVSG